MLRQFQIQREEGMLHDLGIKFFWLKHKEKKVITHNATYQANYLDTYVSDCDDFSTAKAVLMASLSSYGSDVLSEVPQSENIDMLNQSVQEMSYSEQTHLMNYLKNEITSDSNIIRYSQYLLETQNAAIQDINSSTQQDAIILFVFEQLSNQVTNYNKVNEDNLIANESLYAKLERYKEREKNAQFADFKKEINYLKQTLSEQSKEKELLTKTFDVFKNKSKKKEAKNIDTKIALEKKLKELDNIVCKIELRILENLLRHELRFLESVSDMNVRSKSKSVKKAKNKEEWKPTGKVFTKIGYVLRPTGRTFTLVGNARLLTRIIVTNKVLLREPIPLEVIAQESVANVYTKRPKVSKTNGSNRKPKIAKSMISNKMEPDTSRGSNTSVAPSSSYVDLRKPDLSYLHVFGALCYPNNDSENLGKLQAKVDIVAATPRAVGLVDALVSTSIDRDAPSTKKSNLDGDLQGKPVNATLYRGMIGSLMSLTSNRPDLIYVGTINMGLWYSKNTGMSLTAYANADHMRCQDTRRSTSGSAQFLGDKLVSWSSKKQKNTAILSIEDSIHKNDNSYGFKIGKKKKFDLNLEILRDIFRICPRIHCQDFDELTTDEDIVSFFKELGHTWEIKSVIDVVVYQMHQPWRTFAIIINRSLSGKTTVSPEEPTRKSKRVKRLANKSTNAPTTGVVIRETPVLFLFKKKEKITVKKCKEINLLSKMALTEEAQYDKFCKKSLRDFHKTHPSGSGTVAKIAPSATKIKPYVTNEGTSMKPGVPDVTEDESTKSEAKCRGRDEDDINNDHDSRSEGSDQESDSEENEEDVKGEKEENNDEFVKTPSNSIDDEDETNVEDKSDDNKDKGMDYTINQFDDDVDVRLYEPVNTDEGLIQKEGTAVVDKHPDSRLGATRDEFMSYLSASITARITEQVKTQLPLILPKEVSNFAPPVIKSMVTESLEHAVLAKKLDWENIKDGDYLFDLTKPLPLVMNGNRQIVPVDYFFNNDLKYLQGGISTMTNTTSITKIKAAQYDLPGIEDMVLNIWSLVKVAYDKHALWGISHWRDQRKTFYGYERCLESSQDVYSTKRILEVTRVENRLTNLLGNGVSDFAIALRMFIRIMVIQKRVEDL
uniref:Retrovirus-related Pol polyprotein from transposon TNT 1-94 n=1 Tax=Tanacetum cinerariifolium TaxID=118510 RepID=A0A6L2KB72_TANCI|nr:hypothetical protein [Tanacetum cinerariifolium]